MILTESSRTKPPPFWSILLVSHSTLALAL